MIDPIYSAAPDRYHGGMKYRRLVRVASCFLKFLLDFGIISEMWIRCQAVKRKFIMLLTRELLILILLITMDLLMDRLRKRSGKS